MAEQSSLEAAMVASSVEGDDAVCCVDWRGDSGSMNSPLASGELLWNQGFWLLATHHDAYGWHCQGQTEAALTFDRSGSKMARPRRATPRPCLQSS
jgi:hypothetical protein